jgi:hypothetical protein
MKGYDASPTDAHRLRLHLRRQHAIEAPVIAWQDALWVRVSAALYNSVADYDAFAAAVHDINLGGSEVAAEWANSNVPERPAHDSNAKHLITGMDHAWIGSTRDKRERFEAATSDVAQRKR